MHPRLRGYEPCLLLLHYSAMFGGIAPPVLIVGCNTLLLALIGYGDRIRTCKFGVKVQCVAITLHRIKLATMLRFLQMSR